MKVGICGLGLIGGSMAKCYKLAGHTVLGFDINASTLGFASLSGIIDGELNESTIPECELILVALYPEATIEYIKNIAPIISKDTILMDLCGVKEQICACGFALAREYGFSFVGGHPMAGTQYSGIKYAKESLFRGAPMVIVPHVFDDIAYLDRISNSVSIF